MMEEPEETSTSSVMMLAAPVKPTCPTVCGCLGLLLSLRPAAGRSAAVRQTAGTGPQGGALDSGFCSIIHVRSSKNIWAPFVLIKTCSGSSDWDCGSSSSSDNTPTRHNVKAMTTKHHWSSWYDPMFCWSRWVLIFMSLTVGPRLLRTCSGMIWGTWQSSRRRLQILQIPIISSIHGMCRNMSDPQRPSLWIGLDSDPGQHEVLWRQAPRCWWFLWVLCVVRRASVDQTCSGMSHECSMFFTSGNPTGSTLQAFLIINIVTEHTWLQLRLPRWRICIQSSVCTSETANSWCILTALVYQRYDDTLVVLPQMVLVCWVYCTAEQNAPSEVKSLTALVVDSKHLLQICHK